MSELRLKSPEWTYHYTPKCVLMRRKPGSTDYKHVSVHRVPKSHRDPVQEYMMECIRPVLVAENKKRIQFTKAQLSKKERPLEKVPLCSDLKDAVRWMKSKGIKSKIAMFSILNACGSKTFKVSFKRAAMRWLHETKTLEKIHARAMKQKSRVEQDTHFALHTLYYLQFGRLAWSKVLNDTIQPTCPYADLATNFILTLTETNKCLCSCYTQYVLAASEEFEHSLVVSCSSPGHINIIVVCPDQRKKCSVAKTECKIELIPFRKKTTVCLGPAEYTKPTIYTMLDSGFRDNWYINVKTVVPEDEFRDMYTTDTRQVALVITTEQEIGCAQMYLTLNRWTVLDSIWNAIGTRETKSQARYDRDIKIINTIFRQNFNSLRKLHHALETYKRSALDVSRGDILEQVEKHKEDLRNARTVFKQAREQIKAISERVGDYPTINQFKNMYLSAYLSTG